MARRARFALARTSPNLDRSYVAKAKTRHRCYDSHSRSRAIGAHTPLRRYGRDTPAAHGVETAIKSRASLWGSAQLDADDTSTFPILEGDDATLEQVVRAHASAETVEMLRLCIAPIPLSSRERCSGDRFSSFGSDDGCTEPSLESLEAARDARSALMRAFRRESAAAFSMADRRSAAAFFFSDSKACSFSFRATLAAAHSNIAF